MVTVNANLQSSFIIALGFAVIFGFQTEYVLTALYFLLLILAFTGPMKTLLFFLLCAIVNILNADILLVPTIRAEPILQMLVCTFCLFDLYVSKNININKFVAITFIIFAFYLLIHSILISEMPTLSLLKSISFVFIAPTIYLSYCSLNHKDKRTFMGILFWTLFFLSVFSFLGFIAGFGYEVNGTGFQGILNHPQTMGIYSGALFMFCCYLISLNRETYGNLIIMILGVLALILVFASQSRTGLLMIIIPSCLAIIYYSKLLFNNLTFLISTIFFILITFLFINIYLDEFISYLVKGSGSDNFTDIAVASRGPLFLAMWNNIIADPILGIGFGVPTDNIFFNTEDASSFAGIIISYPIEKGILFFALLEELGLIGFFLFLMLLTVIIYVSLKKNILGAMLGISILSSNITEATFMSFGGAGLILFIFFTVGVVSLRRN